MPYPSSSYYESFKSRVNFRTEILLAIGDVSPPPIVRGTAAAMTHDAHNIIIVVLRIDSLHLFTRTLFHANSRAESEASGMCISYLKCEAHPSDTREWREIRIFVLYTNDPLVVALIKTHTHTQQTSRDYLKLKTNNFYSIAYEQKNRHST